jgi:hypothetical protein
VRPQLPERIALPFARRRSWPIRLADRVTDAGLVAVVVISGALGLVVALAVAVLAGGLAAAWLAGLATWVALVVLHWLASECWERWRP